MIWDNINATEVQFILDIVVIISLIVFIAIYVRDNKDLIKYKKNKFLLKLGLIKTHEK